MTKAERQILQTLDEIVRSEKVRSQIQPVIGRVRAELARSRDALMTWEPVALDVFGENLPRSIRSVWIFVLRPGVDTGAERHSNSHQRMLTIGGTGDMKIDIKAAKNDVASESEIEWRSNVLIDDPNASLEQRWISIPPNVWHRPVIPTGADWIVISFHTVPADDLVEERPGAKRMFYATERKQRDQVG